MAAGLMEMSKPILVSMFSVEVNKEEKRFLDTGGKDTSRNETKYLLASGISYRTNWVWLSRAELVTLRKFIDTILEAE